MRLDMALRWTARLWSIASIAVLLAFAFGGRESIRPTAAQAVGVLLFPVGVTVGLVVAWRREGLGGLVSVCSLALFYFWMFTRLGRMPTGPYFLLLAAPGFLFIACALGAMIDRRSGGVNSGELPG